MRRSMRAIVTDQPSVLRAVFAIVGVAACADVHQEPTAVPSRNACPEFSCAAYDQAFAPQCDEGVCQVKRDIEYTLVVTMPGSSAYANQTFALRSRDFPRLALSEGGRLGCKQNECLVFQAPGAVTGQYTVTSALARELGLFLGRRNAAPNALTTIPAQVTLRPLWPDATGIDGDRAGLSVQAIAGTNYVCRVDGDVASVDCPDGVRSRFGPDGTSPLGFRAFAPPGVYERAVYPEPPFDAVYPPFVETLTLGVRQNDDSLLSRVLASASEPQQNNYRALDPSSARTGVVDRNGGVLDGFRMWLRDAKSHRRISSTSSLAGVTSGVTLNTFNRDLVRGTELVLAPPMGVAAPTFITAVTPIGGGGFPKQTYPALPPPVAVTGRLTRGGPDFVAALVVFESITIDTRDPNEVARNFLSFTTSVRVESGEFTVSLPQGTYRAYARPLFSDDVGRLVQDEIVVRSPLVLDLVLPSLTPVTGRVTLTDGRPLVAADVVATFAVSSLGQPDVTLATHRLPKLARAQTDEAGRFTLFVESGEYDLVVRPGPETRLPWYTLRSFRLPGELPPIAVPAPIRQSHRLFDPDGNALAFAPVRAYLQVDGVALEIGRAVTDRLGRFDLWLAPP